MVTFLIICLNDSNITNYLGRIKGKFQKNEKAEKQEKNQNLHYKNNINNKK